MKKALLIGGGGFIGKHLAKSLVDRDWSVFIGSRSPASTQTEFAGSPHVQRIEFHLDRAPDIKAFLREHNPDAVVHLAAETVPSSPANEIEHERANIVEPTKRLIDIVAETSAKFVFLSSGGAIYGASRPGSRRESDPCEPVSGYGRHKLELERYIIATGQNARLRYLIVRPSNPYGPGQSLHGRQGLVSVILGKLISKDHLEIRGSGHVLRDYIHVEDLADAVAHLISSDRGDGVYNIGSGVGHSALDVVSIIERVSGQQLEVVRSPDLSSDAGDIVLDITALKDAGIATPRPLETGIRDYMSGIGLLP
jgi:UDP-glucose 4-epimerase